MENNEKKRVWGRRFFGEQAIVLISGAFVLCMFNFNDMSLLTIGKALLFAPMIAGLIWVGFKKQQ